MTVRDLLTLAQKSIVIVNSDVAASATVATRYRAMYGIPSANVFTYAMGAGVLWEYTADRFAGFWTDLYNKVQSVGAYAIFTTPGCPVGIEVLTDDGEGNGAENPNGNGLNFALLVGFVKRIIANGYEPRIYYDSNTYFRPVGIPSWDASTLLYDYLATHKGSQTKDATAIAGLVTLGTDATHQAAGASNIDAFKFTLLRGANSNWSTVDNLLTGHIGYYTQTEGTHPAGLDTLSWPIIGKAGNLQKPASQQSGVSVLCCPQTLTSSNYCHESSQALIGKKLADLGLSVSYWYPSAPGAVAEALLPAAGGMAWTSGNLDANTTTPASVTYQYLVGCGPSNGTEATWGGATKPMRASTSGGLICCGQSDGYKWGKQGMVDSGHSYIQHIREPAYGYHQGALQQGKLVDIWLNLINGRALCEAAWCGLEYSFLAVGDPLARPFA